MTRIILILTALSIGACNETPRETTGSVDHKTPVAEAPAAETVAKAEKASPKLPLPENTNAITIADLATMVQSKAGFVFDANSEHTRKEFGLIPTATPLKNYASCAEELPDAKDKTMVFYCSSEMCTASHKAAEVAVGAGYQDVRILAPGIRGWVGAGQNVTKL